MSLSKKERNIIDLLFKKETGKIVDGSVLNNLYHYIVHGTQYRPENPKFIIGGNGFLSKFTCKTLDKTLPKRNYSIMLNNDISLICPQIIIQITFQFKNPYSCRYDTYKCKEELFPENKHSTYIFRHPTTNTWFYIKHGSVKFTCSSCDGGTESSLILCEERNLSSIIKYHLDDYERMELFGNKLFCCNSKII